MLPADRRSTINRIVEVNQGSSPPMRPPLPTLKALWSGALPLRDAFWDYAVFWGLLINLGTAGLSLLILLAKRHAGLPEDIAAVSAPAVFALHLIPLPYNVVALVGVWRSAAHQDVPLPASTIARVAAITLFILFLVI